MRVSVGLAWCAARATVGALHLRLRLRRASVGASVLLRLSCLHLCVPAPVPAVTVGVAQGPVSLGEECLVGETRVKDHA